MDCSHSHRLEGDGIALCCAAFWSHQDDSHTGTNRRCDAHLLTGFLGYGHLRAHFTCQLHRVVGFLRIKACQFHAVEINHFEEGVRRQLDAEIYSIFAFGTTFRRYGKDLRGIFQHTQHTLRCFTFHVRYSGYRAHAFGQNDGIVQRIRSKAFQVFAIQFNHLQRRVAGSSHREMDNIGSTLTTLRAYRDTVVTVDTTFTHIDFLQCFIGSLRRVGYFRERSSTLRQVHPILVRLRIESNSVAFAIKQRTTFYTEVGKGIVGVTIYGEGDQVNRCIAIAGSYCDTRCSVQTTSYHTDVLELVVGNRFNRREFGCTDRQRIFVGGNIRTEVRQCHAAYFDALQGGNLRFLGAKHQLVDGLIHLVAGSYDHTGRSIESAEFDLRFCLILIATAIENLR